MKQLEFMENNPNEDKLHEKDLDQILKNLYLRIFLKEN